MTPFSERFYTFDAKQMRDHEFDSRQGRYGKILIIFVGKFSYYFRQPKKPRKGLKRFKLYKIKVKIVHPTRGHRTIKTFILLVKSSGEKLDLLGPLATRVVTPLYTDI